MKLNVWLSRRWLSLNDTRAAIESFIGGKNIMTEYEFHPLANMFPLLEGGEFDALVEDIRAHGLNEPLVMFEGKILDGRNRCRACAAVGIEPRFREMDFGNYAAAKAYVISANIHRPQSSDAG
jgi:hypothetical protein